MAEDHTLTKALVDVRARRAALQSDFDRIAEELTKLRAAEAALTSIVEGVPLEQTAQPDPHDNARRAGYERASLTQVGRRSARGPRSNSAKGRLKAILGSAGPQGLSHAEISERLSDVAPNTLNTYLSMMTTSGEAIRNGDFFTATGPVEALDDQLVEAESANESRSSGGMEQDSTAAE